MTGADALRPRTAVPADLFSIIKICAASPAAPQWSEEQFRAMVHATEGTGAIRRAVLVAGPPGEVLGFTVVSALVAVFPVEAELESIAVDPGSRRRGVGAALLIAARLWAVHLGAGVLRLEVRTGNTAAQGLYAAAGFVQAGLRRNYYRAPVEDAVMMELQTSSIA